MSKTKVLSKYDVSIIIVNYKTATIIKDCILSITKQTIGISYEIIVVDNNSCDDIANVIQSINMNNLHLVQLEDNLGFGKANNEGSKYAQGKCLFFLNPDTLLLNNAISILFHHIEEKPTVGIIGGNLYDEQMNPALSYRKVYPGIKNELYEMTCHYVENIIYRKNWCFNHTDSPNRVAYISGADLMITKMLFDKIEGFSKEFFMYCEDTDLCLKVHNMGYLIENNPNAKIQHLEGKSTKRKEGLVSEKGLLMSENGRIEYYKKNINLPTYMLGNIIYILSLNLLSFISYVFQMPSHNAFKIRKRIVPSLFFEGFIHKIKH